MSSLATNFNKGVPTPDDQLDYPHLIERPVSDTMSEIINFRDQDTCLHNIVEAIRLRIRKTNHAPTMAIHSISPDPISLNQKCEDLRINLKKTIRHIKKCGYPIHVTESSEEEEHEKVYLIAPSDWITYSQSFAPKI